MAWPGTEALGDGRKEMDFEHTLQLYPALLVHGVDVIMRKEMLRF